MAGRCEACGRDVDMPFECTFCDGRYCGKHRLPEKHDCHGLAAHKQRLREEGRLIYQPGRTLEQDRGTAGGGGVRGRIGGAVDGALRFLEGRAALVFLGIMVGVFVLEQVAYGVSPALFEALFVMGPGFYREPWTIVTSIFAHGSTTHLLVNGIVLFFFGPTLERLVGTRRFVGLFLGAGVAAGLVQVTVFAYLLPALGFPGSQAGVLGASGAIMGILGTLTILAPNTTVLLFFIVPAPLWLVTAGYALYDLSGVFFGSNGVANLAHLTGLAIGLYVGWDLKGKGLGRRLRQGGLGGGGAGGVQVRRIR